eukprot:18286-Hanusia_phi.AAC.1
MLQHDELRRELELLRSLVLAGSAQLEAQLLLVSQGRRKFVDCQDADAILTLISRRSLNLVASLASRVSCEDAEESELGGSLPARSLAALLFPLGCDAVTSAISQIIHLHRGLKKQRDLVQEVAASHRAGLADQQQHRPRAPTHPSMTSQLVQGEPPANLSQLAIMSRCGVFAAICMHDDTRATGQEERQVSLRSHPPAGHAQLRMNQREEEEEVERDGVMTWEDFLADWHAVFRPHREQSPGQSEHMGPDDVIHLDSLDLHEWHAEYRR